MTKKQYLPLTALALIIIIVAVLISTATIPISGTDEINNINPEFFFIQDGLIPPDFNDVKSVSSVLPDPGFYETSEYMMGSCAVSVIFLESNGAIDASTEDWTSTEVNQAKSEMVVIIVFSVFVRAFGSYAAH